MMYCTKCGKPTNNGIMCEDCIISDSPWLLALKRKEDDLVEQIEQLKAENAEIRHRAEAAEYRAEVYEQALYHTAISDTEYQEAIEQAQKKLAEEGKK